MRSGISFSKKARASAADITRLTRKRLPSIHSAMRRFMASSSTTRMLEFFSISV